MQFAYRKQPPPMGKTALRWGLIFGLLHGILSSILTLLADTILNRISGMLTLLSIPLACIFFFLAGFLAARQSGRITGGTLGGLWAGITSKILSTILAVLFLLVFHLPRSSQLSGQAISSTQLIPFFVLELLFLVLDIGLGGSFGALGGRFGKGPSKEEATETTGATLPASTRVSIRPSETLVSREAGAPRAPEALSVRSPSQLSTSAEVPDTDPVADPYPYGKPFFPPPYPVPPTQSRRPQ
jgi:hypothetical protein